ncbi:hypothetical protein T484DRAFT_1809396, partial [Baffinella frigidus]
VVSEYSADSRPPHGEGVVSGYSADSRPSTARGSQGWDELDWPDQLLLKAVTEGWDELDWPDQLLPKAVTETHGMAAESSQEVMRKTALCLNDGCNQWVDKTRLDEHRRCCPYRRARKCPFFDCAKWVEADQLEAHKNTCEFGLRVECEWCFQQVAGGMRVVFQAGAVSPALERKNSNEEGGGGEDRVLDGHPIP